MGLYHYSNHEILIKLKLKFIKKIIIMTEEIFLHKNLILKKKQKIRIKEHKIKFQKKFYQN
jgi:hypothetical protein